MGRFSSLPDKSVEFWYINNAFDSKLMIFDTNIITLKLLKFKHSLRSLSELTRSSENPRGLSEVTETYRKLSRSANDKRQACHYHNVKSSGNYQDLPKTLQDMPKVQTPCQKSTLQS